MTVVIKTIKYIDEQARVLWEEPMIFKRLFAVADDICEKGKWYVVTNVRVLEEVQIVTLKEE